MADETSLKVVHVAPTPFFADRGCHMRIRGIVSALNEKSVRNVVCTYHHGREVPGITTLRTPEIPRYTQLEAGPNHFKYIADVLLLILVLRTIWRERPDVIHGHLHEGVLIGWIARLLLFFRPRPLLVFDVQGSLVGELTAYGYIKKSNVLLRLFRGLEYVITRLPDVLVCSSDASADILREEYDVPADKIVLIGDGVDTAEVRPEIVRRFRERFALPVDRPLVVYTGGLLPAKGIEILKEALLIAHRDNLNVHFLIVGYPDAAFRKFVREYGLEPICTVVGRVPYEDLASYLSLADVAIEPKASPSGEASGKILNYMGAGLPVVCFDTPANRALLQDAAYLAEDATAEALVRQVKEALHSPDEAAERGFRGRARSHSEFSWSERGEQMLSTYLSRFDSLPERSNLSVYESSDVI